MAPDTAACDAVTYEPDRDADYDMEVRCTEPVPRFGRIVSHNCAPWWANYTYDRARYCRSICAGMAR